MKATGLRITYLSVTNRKNLSWGLKSSCGAPRLAGYATQVHCFRQV